MRSDATLVATIDEHEVNRLGVLLDQLFPESTRQLVTIVNNPKGVTQGYLSRVEEYAFFVFGPDARIGSVDDDLLTHRDMADAEGNCRGLDGRGSCGRATTRFELTVKICSIRCGSMSRLGDSATRAKHCHLTKLLTSVRRMA